MENRVIRWHAINDCWPLTCLQIDFVAGADAIDYSDIAKKEHLKPLELELRKLEDRVEGIHKELVYQRDREEVRGNRTRSLCVVVFYVCLSIHYVSMFWIQSHRSTSLVAAASQSNNHLCAPTPIVSHAHAGPPQHQRKHKFARDVVLHRLHRDCSV